MAGKVAGLILSLALVLAVWHYWTDDIPVVIERIGESCLEAKGIWLDRSPIAYDEIRSVWRWNCRSGLIHPKIYWRAEDKNGVILMSCRYHLYSSMICEECVFQADDVLVFDLPMYGVTRIVVVVVNDQS